MAKISSVAELCLLANGELAGQEIDLQDMTLTHVPQSGTDFCKELILHGSGTTLRNGTLILDADTQITLRAPNMTLQGIHINGAFSFTNPCRKGSVLWRWESFCTMPFLLCDCKLLLISFPQAVFWLPETFVLVGIGHIDVVKL